MYQVLLDEYRDHRIKKSFSKDDLFNLLSRYAKGVFSGTDVEVFEHENELIAMLEA